MKVQRLYVFGSVVSDFDFDQSSDLDFLIQFREDLSIEEYSENYFQMHYMLREIFDREIDLVTENSLSNPYFIEKVNSTKVLVYED